MRPRDQVNGQTYYHLSILDSYIYTLHSLLSSDIEEYILGVSHVRVVKRFVKQHLKRGHLVVVNFGIDDTGCPDQFAILRVSGRYLLTNCCLRTVCSKTVTDVLFFIFYLGNQFNDAQLIASECRYPSLNEWSASRSADIVF